jgi:dTDP-4-dehydrorhamnose 3,5-epimerase-like enzyme
MVKAKLITSKPRKLEYGIGIIFNEEICDFVIKRIFYIYDINSSMSRGNHANINTTMCFIILQGHCEIFIDDGRKKKTFFLKNQDEILICSPMTWKEMKNFSPDCILMVICDTYFDPDDYIDDYKIFKQTLLNK